MFGRKNKEESGFFGTLLGGMLLTPLLGKAEDFFVGIVASAKEATEEYVQRLVRAMIVALAGLIGLVFLLIGLAQYLSDLYALPWIGQMIVGAVIVLLSLVWYLVPGKRK